jgi:hypothetical protein
MFKNTMQKRNTSRTILVLLHVYEKLYFISSSVTSKINMEKDGIVCERFALLAVL